MGIVTIDRSGKEAFNDNQAPDDMSFTNARREFHPPHQPKTDYRAILAYTIAGCVSFLVFWLIYGFWKLSYCWNRNYETCQTITNIEPLVFGAVFGGVWLLAVAAIVFRIAAHWRQARAITARTNLVLDRFGDQIPVNMFERIPDAHAFLTFIQDRYNTANELQRVIAPYQQYRSVNSLSLNSTNNTSTPMLEVDTMDEGLTPVLPDEWLKWINNKPHFMIAGKTGEGKSVTARALLSTRFVPNSQFMIIDPQSNGWFNFATVGNGWQWGEIVDAIIALHDEYMRRHAIRADYVKQTNEGLPVEHFPRLNTLMDEAFEISKKLDTGSSKTKINYWEMYAETLGSSARVVNIGAGMLTQTANVEDIGLSGPLRANFTRLAIDAISIKQMIKQEEADPSRREMLYAALIGMTYPATTVVGMNVELLDRTGLDQITMPKVGPEHVWPFVRSSQNANNGHNGALRTDGQNGHNMIDRLRVLRMSGVSREEAREDLGLVFSNDDWTLAQ